MNNRMPALAAACALLTLGAPGQELRTVDLSRDTARQAVLAAGTPAVWTIGHGGTTVAATHLKYWNGKRRHSVVCTRFTLAETGALSR